MMWYWWLVIYFGVMAVVATIGGYINQKSVHLTDFKDVIILCSIFWPLAVPVILLNTFVRFFIDLGDGRFHA